MSGETDLSNLASLKIPGISVGTAENCWELDEEELTKEFCGESDTVELPFFEVLDADGFPTKATTIRNTTKRTDRFFRSLKKIRCNYVLPSNVKNVTLYKNLSILSNIQLEPKLPHKKEIYVRCLYLSGISSR